MSQRFSEISTSRLEPFSALPFQTAFIDSSNLQRSSDAAVTVGKVAREQWAEVDAAKLAVSISDGVTVLYLGSMRTEFRALGGNYKVSEQVPRLANVVERRVDLSWLTELYSSNENVRISSSQLQSVISNINSLLARRRFDDMAFLLASLKLDRVAPEVLIAFARQTAQVRNHIAHWTAFIGKAEQSLNVRGMNGKKLLRGLGQANTA
jgi:hypothetical protein